MNRKIKNHNFRKYYLLEDYLFNEVRYNFNKRGYLTAEEFFCIIIWKSNRNKSKIKNKLTNIGKEKNLKTLDTIIKKVTSEIFIQKRKEDKLKILLDTWKFRLPIASAILTVLYPEEFTVYDDRVLNEIILKDFVGRKKQITKYFNDYIPKVIIEGEGDTLRDKDKYLWGRSFYRDLVKFIERVD